MSTPRFRTARDHDVSAIVELLFDDDLGREREHPDDLGPYRDAFAAIDATPSEELIVAELEGAVVGCVQLSVLPSLTRGAATRGHLEGVRVSSAHRGTGLGRQLIDHAVARARDHGCRRMQLTTDVRRPDAHRFYERLGFVATHTGFTLELD